MLNNNSVSMKIPGCALLFILLHVQIHIGHFRVAKSNKRGLECPLNDDEIYKDDMRMSRRRNMLIDPSFRWPNAQVCYIITGDFDSEETRIIKHALTTGFDGTCVNTIECRDCCHGDYINIKNDQEGCFSDMGRIGGEQELNLGDNCVDHGTVLHEVMHAIGFAHEQSNPNRDDYIDIITENIDPEQLFNFDKLYDITNLGLPYDLCSIMHYDECAFSINGYRTIIPKQEPNCTMGDIYDLSPTDKLKVNLMYNCTQGK